MHPRPLPWPTAHVCWKCQWRVAVQHRRLARPTPARNAIALVAGRRALHGTHLRRQPSTAPANSPPAFDPAFPQPHSLPIRKRLQLKQKELGGPDEEALQAFGNYPRGDEMLNGLSRLSHTAKADDGSRGNEIEGDEDNDGDDLITIGLFLKPGDVVELSQSGREPVLAVFVQQLALTSQFFSVNGRWCHSRLVEISFAIPGAIDPALVQPLIPFMPTDTARASPKGEIHVPRHFGVPVMEILGNMTKEAERIYRQNAPVLDTAYSMLADKTRARMMTLNQIAKTLLGKADRSWKPSPAALLAVRKALNHNAFRFRSDGRSQRLTNVFAIRPTDDVQAIETVQDWVREYNEHKAAHAINPIASFQRQSRGAQNISNFVEKARRLIATSREHREPNAGFLGPSKASYAVTDSSAATRTAFGEEFTSADKQIITFLQAWALQIQFAKMSSFYACGVAIIRATECYEGEGTIKNLPGGLQPDPNRGRTDTIVGFLFLQEIGVLTPHEDRTIYDEQLMLPSVRLSRNLELLITKAELTRRNPDFRDSMADLRRDWGAMTVYCIDGEGAKEIDDGISIANVPGKESEYWVHVHVANPTAFFNKTHVLSGLAAHMTESVYTPQRSFPMLPKWASQSYFSLDRNRPVLTFSTRMDRSGNILETKIQPGIVRKIISLTPTEVSEYIGECTQVVQTTKLVVGGEVPSTVTNRTRPKLSSGEIQEIRDMYTAARAMWSRRKAAGGIRIGQGDVEVRVFERPGQAGLAWTPPSVDRTRLIQGDPIIELIAKTAESSTQQEIDSSNIVEEMMIQACQTAASWCGERNIPAMYRGSVEAPGADDLSLEQLQKQVVFPHLQKHGRLSRSVGFRYLAALGKAIAHSSPLPHKIIGVKSYLRVTSPLRRFSDMIAHWQIEAALRYEARTGKKFNADATKTTDRPVLPFSKEQMQESIITLSPREKIIQKTNTYSAHFWVCLAWMRAFYYKEASLPATMKVWIRSVGEENSMSLGFLRVYSIAVRVLKIPADGFKLEVGDEWEAEVYSINVFRRQICMRPIRLLHRESDVE
ncbi:RNB-domain-containing protein [Melanomma pulvis-pyrius CBS 109.77]|uniref:RNB-domain-containing protein n=1 Tax=Melanomma pulvis-pyrius CBS 109.77 TaxID=1314802 RepID=A0A6A6X4R4_9PLEO|nr:RNB-domain-containing protein [Melanomma pulvis-pyrius CBS 109.77]